MTRPGDETFSLRTAWLSGPRLIGRAPRAFFSWVLLRMVGQYVAMAGALGLRAAHVDPLASSLWGAAIDLPFQAVLMTAAVRGCLDLGDPRRAFLGLGRTEGRMLLLILLAGLTAMLIGLPVSIVASYVAYLFKLKLLAGSVLAVGTAVAAVSLMRLATLPAAVVDLGRLDLAAALAASRGRYLALTASVLLAALIERLAQDSLRALLDPPLLMTWTALISPPRLVAVLWESLTAILSLAVMAGVTTTAWRAKRQTLS